MNLSAAYLKKRGEWQEEGEQRGIYRIANNLLRQGMSVELVSQVTELSIEQINQLREQLS